MASGIGPAGSRTWRQASSDEAPGPSLDWRTANRDAAAMAVSGTVPARPGRRGFDPLPLSRWLQRLTVVMAVGLAIWIFSCFGTEWVPKGMDTVPSMPPGSWCVIDRRSSQVAVGRDVFVHAPGVGLLLSRIAELSPDNTITVRHPNAASTWPDSRSFGALPRSAIRGVVSVVLPPDPEPSGANRGR